MTRTMYDNVGAVDSAIRFVLGVALIASVGVLWALAPPDYAPAGLLLIVPAAYLILSAAIHVDLLYAMLGLDTVPGHVHHRAMTRPRI